MAGEREAPLIFTSKGNLPESDLERRPQWQFVRDAADPSIVTEIHFINEYFLNGESVKRGVDIYKPNAGVAADAIAAKLG